MKILAVTDIHQMISKWKELVKVCQNEKFDVVAVAGDLFPKDTYIEGQLSFLPNFKKYLTKIKNTGAEIVLILGNDDNQNAIPEVEQYSKDGLIHYIPNNVIEIDGYEFAAMPYVPDYPFGYKFWCHAEFKDAMRIDPQQFTDPVLINKDNKFEIIKDYKAYLQSKISIYDALVETESKVKNIEKSIWLVLCPPSQLMLDICAHGARVGSDAVLKFIEEYHPLITIHGHIHESPEHNGHKWFQHHDGTLCIQGGQVGYDLHYSTIKIENGEVKTIKHSIYK